MAEFPQPGGRGRGADEHGGSVLALVDAGYGIRNGWTARACCIAQEFTQYPVINYNGNEYEKECIYV